MSEDIIKALDRLALDIGVLAEADFCREQVCEENAVEVIGRISELVKHWIDRDSELTEVEICMTDCFGWYQSSEDTIADMLGRIRDLCAAVDRFREPLPKEASDE